MSTKVSRSTVNEQQYSAPDFPKSGFQLSHRRYSSFMLGRMHVSGYQNVMPGDKISGQNKGNFTLKRIVTPMVSPIDVAQYNFYLPFRAIDRTFERAFAPGKNNQMSSSWSAPTINTRDLVASIFNKLGLDSSSLFAILYRQIEDYANSGTLQQAFDASSLSSDSLYHVLYNKTNGIISSIIKSLKEGEMYQLFKNYYLDDILIDIIDNIEKKLGTSYNPISSSILFSDFIYIFLDCILSPFVGRYSYYGEFNYQFVRPFDLYRISHGIGVDASSFSTFDGLITSFSDIPLSEYPIRAMYAIWYEKFRNVDLEPVSGDLPDWRDFGSTSVVELPMLVYRPRPWYEDMFTTAQIDDLSRHVYAPILATSNDNVSYHNKDYNNHEVNNQGFDESFSNQKPSTYVISWRDQLNDEIKYIQCPVPSNINDILSASDNSFYDVYGLDLNTLRQSQQLERYLKRNYLFGDEYQDRMLAHYNSRVSDMRINRPELLSQSLNSADYEQEVANVTTAGSQTGDRVATGTLSCGGDQYTTFCEEFGILIHVLTFMPLASYDGIQPQLLATKFVDFPLPEFATNNEEFGRKLELADSSIDTTLTSTDHSDNRFMFGRYPAYHAWRQRVDQVGGDFLDELQDCTFRRFWGMFNDDTTPKLNYQFIHCRPNLNMFANNILYDAQIYGDVIHECFVERVLPTPVEVI